MPIKGVSEVVKYQIGGKLRLGEKRVSQRTGNEYPVKLEYFKFDPKDPEMLEVFNEIYGERPKKLNIQLVSEDPEEYYPQYYKVYNAAGELLCKGTGETALRPDFDTGAQHEVECLGPENCPFSLEKGKNGRPGCAARANLMFALPDMPGGTTLWQCDTGSFYSIAYLNTAIEQVRSVYGRVSFVDLILELVPQPISVPGKEGKKTKSVAYVLNLKIKDSLRSVMSGEAQKQAALPMAESAETVPRLVMPEPIEEAPLHDERTQKEIDDDGVVDVSTSDALAEDGDVRAAFEHAGFSPAKCNAFLNSADQNGWNKSQLLDAIEVNIQQAQQSGNSNPPKPKEEAPAPANNPAELF